LKFIYRRRVFCAVWLSVIFLFLVQLPPQCSAATFDDARVGVSRAEQDVGLAFLAVAEAEGAEANVGELLNKLDEAGVLLSEANHAFDARDYDAALSSAMSASSVVDGVADYAMTLKVLAEKSRGDRLLYAVAISGAGLFLLAVFSFYGWRSLKRRYVEQVLDMKPEVN
jgi:hypothetical protein